KGEILMNDRKAMANINMHAFELGDFGKLRKTIPMAAKKNIALVAHDNKKDELLEWAKFNCKLLAAHSLYSTGTTGSILTSQLGLDVTNLQSGPLGGDQQIGSRISEGKIDFLIFFWDPLEAQPHDPNVKALLRIAVVWNVPMACNRATADFVISSALMSRTYDRLVPDYDEYEARPVVVPSRSSESAVRFS
ncbi:MAG TPA: methylglyoxal synthase, partial [Candidatus Acidoferrum sp.]|nr:methylglyoxal synthase [Candidatus Acidoferrum sp.]